jgi:putative NADH-flavin reductase
MNKIRGWLLMTLVTLTSIVSTSVHAERIVIFGATGNIGTAIVREALDRGHEVIGVSRSPENFSYTEENFTGVAGNPTILESILEVTLGADAVINAVGGREAATPEETAMNQSAITFTSAFAGRGEEGPQLVVVGGGFTSTGSLEKLLENIPASATEGSPFRALFVGHWYAYQTYLASDINWTFVAPPLSIVGFGNTPGEDIRTGEYRTSIEGFVYDADGNNSITKSDLAFAILDFAESGEFNQVKVALGY